MHTRLASELLTAVREILDPLFSTYHIYSCHEDGSEIVVKVQRTDDLNERTLVLRILINHAAKQIGIPNIFIPADLQHNGYGKKVIATVYAVAVQHGYEVFIIDLVQSFFKRLVNRGAEVIDDETVRITSATRLSA
jgi:predicted acetyltransferase